MRFFTALSALACLAGCLAYRAPVVAARQYHGQDYTEPTQQTSEDLYSWGGKLDAAQTLDLRLHFRPHNAAALDAYVASLDDPSSPNFHAYLSLEQFNKRFGHHPLDEQMVRSYLRAEGFDVGETRGGIMRVRARVEDIDRVLGTDMRRVYVPGHPPMFASSTTPQVSASLGVEDIVGLVAPVASASGRATKVMEADITYGDCSVFGVHGDDDRAVAVIEANRAVVSDMTKHAILTSNALCANTSVFVGGFDERVHQEDTHVAVTLSRAMSDKLLPGLEMFKVIEVGTRPHAVLDCLSELAHPAAPKGSLIKWAVLLASSPGCEMCEADSSSLAKVFKQLAAQGQTVIVAPGYVPVNQEPAASSQGEICP